MNISIRIKIFVILLAFSLGPLLVARGLMTKASGRLIKDTSEQMREELLEMVSSDLEHTALTLLQIMDRSGRIMRMGVRSLADGVSFAIQSEPETTAAQIYFAKDMLNPGNRPSDMVKTEHYMKRTRGGRSKAVEVSYNWPAIHLPRGVDAESVAEDITLVARITPLFYGILQDLPDVSFWLNVTLESGVHVTYPGHGDIPPMYDPRNQEWYIEARRSDTGRWYRTVDPTTRNIVTTIAFPIRDEEGTFLGCASIDLPVHEMLPDDELQAYWEGDVRTLLVGRDPSGDEHRKGIPIFAQQEALEGRRHWMTKPELEWFMPDDEVGYQVLLKALDMQRSGVVPLSCGGDELVCAFATSGDDYSMLVVIPKKVMGRLPNEIGGSFKQIFDEVRDISYIMAGVMLILIGIIAWFGSRAFTKPLIAMIEVARRLSHGDFSARMVQRTGDERDDLIDSFNEMGPKLKELMQLNKDMELAEEVQRLLLPHGVPELGGYDLSGGIVYCDQTGGDYYDFLEVKNRDGDSVSVVIGDVSGHGIPSALVMAAARGQLHTLSSVPMGPHERIRSINDVLSRDLFGTGRFLTLFYLRLRRDDSKVHWVRAGHDPAIRYNPATDEFSELAGEGIPLGVLEGFKYESYQAELKDGEVLVMTTDGVWEARDAEGKMFGKKRMLANIRENAHKNAEEIRLALMRAVEDYQANGQEDDIAVVVVKKTDGKAMTKDMISFRMTNKENCFKCFQPKVEEFGAAHGLHMKIIFHLTLVLDELITNIISYGYADFDEHPIDVSISLDGDELIIRVEDNSEPFNILEAPAPELDVPLDEREKPIGGMGIHLIKNMVHGINYSRENGKNVLVLNKNVSKTHCPVSDAASTEE